MKQVVSISLSPNTEQEDIVKAVRILLRPWSWKKGKETGKIGKMFETRFGGTAACFNSGRSSLQAVIRALGIEGGEVLVQGFTCNAVPNPVRWEWCAPVYVDCGQDYNMDPADLEKKITERSKAVIVQHTFGIPANLSSISALCKKYNLFLIEDCAHALGATYNGKEVGSFGDAAIFSFSRDKVVSSVYGGVAVVKNKEHGAELLRIQESMEYPSLAWIKQQLLHPILLNLCILPWYMYGGKYMLVLLQGLKILSKAVHAKEKQGKEPSYFPKRMPNALAELALLQLGKLDRFNAHRRKVVEAYRKGLAGTPFGLPKEIGGRESIYLRLPVQHKNAHAIIRKAWSYGLLLGDWYTSVIAPADTNQDAVGYVTGMCPIAEELSRTTLNLPTHIRLNKEKVREIIQFLKTHAG